MKREKLKYPNKYLIDDLKLFAKNKSGECLSNEYIYASTKYIWKCQYGHIWEANWNNIKNYNRWCKFCAWENLKVPRKWNIKDLQDYAFSKNGKCLSESYNSTNNKYIWQCENNHIWKAKWSNIISFNSWCGLCGTNGSKGEEIIDFYLKNSLKFINNKDYFRQFKFEDCRYKNPLFFDFYIPKYKLIIEFDGQQHFYTKPDFWTKKMPLEIYQLKDEIKNKYCEINNLKIIRIPFKLLNYIEKILDNESIYNFNRTLNLSSILINRIKNNEKNRPCDLWPV